MLVARFVGRVGALAVALGVGSVVATTPGVSYADTTDSGSSTASSPAADPSSATESPSRADSSADAGSPAQDTFVADDAPAEVAQSTVESSASVMTGDGPTVVVSGSGGALSSAFAADDGSDDEVPLDELVDGDDSESASPAAADTTVRPRVAPAGVDGLPSARRSASAPEIPPQSRSVAASAAADRTGLAPVGAVAGPARRVAATAAAVRVDAVPVVRGVVSAAVTTTPAVSAMADAPASALSLPGAVVAMVSNVLTAALGPLLTIPGAPAAPSPTLFGVLAWVRREIEHTLFNNTPDVQDRQVTLELNDATATSGAIALGAGDPDGDTLAYSVPGRGATGGPTKGTVTIDQATGTFVYNPDDDFARTGGTDTFTVSVSDEGSGFHLHGLFGLLDPGAHGGTAVVTITVVGTDTTTPTARDDSYSTHEDGSLVVSAAQGVLANDADPNGDVLQASLVTRPANGTVAMNPDGSFIYVPDADFVGSDSFTYQATDGRAVSSEATVAVTVSAVPDPPVAVDDTASTSEDVAVVITPMANDTDADGDPLLVLDASAPAHGGVVVNADNSITYTPAADFAGEDVFTYTVSDGSATSVAKVTVTANPVQDPPKAVDDAYTTSVNQSLVVLDPTQGLLSNDTDADGDELTAVLVTGPAHGSMLVDDTGAFIYVPAAGYFGVDSFTYRAVDGRTTGGTDTATVSILVNRNPLIEHVGSTLGVGNTWVVTVTVSDPEGDAVSTSVVGGDASIPVTTTLLPGGAFGVVADADWARAHPGAQVPVTITVTDSRGGTAQTTVDIGTANNVAAVGYNVHGQVDIPALPAGVTYTQVATGVYGYNTVLLRSDGTAVSVGDNNYGQNDIPPLPAGITYTQVAVGYFNTILLRSDGQVVAIGYNSSGQNDIPPLPPGVTYTRVNASNAHAVLLRSDGTAVGVGSNQFGETTIPPLPAGVTYTEVATNGAYGFHTVLLRSDGTAVAVGYDYYGQATIPPLPTGVTYTQAATGLYHTVLLRSDGTAVAAGYNFYEQSTIPPLPVGVTYTEVAASMYSTVLLRSDGTVVAFGFEVGGQNDIPPLDPGVTYTHVEASYYHTVLMRSDGSAVVLGYDVYGQTNIPARPDGVVYTDVVSSYFTTVWLSSIDPSVV